MKINIFFEKLVKLPNFKSNFTENQPSDVKYAGQNSNSIDSKDKPPMKKPLKVPSLKVFINDILFFHYFK